jgi:hypothetical protein
MNKHSPGPWAWGPDVPDGEMYDLLEDLEYSVRGYEDLAPGLMDRLTSLLRRIDGDSPTDS